MRRKLGRLSVIGVVLTTLAACTSSSSSSSSGGAGGRGSAGAEQALAGAGSAGSTEAGSAGLVGDIEVAGAGSSGSAGTSGSAGSAGSSAPTTVAYTSSAATKTSAAGLLNLGQEFRVTLPSIVVRDLGFWDEGANGLIAPHAVTLFSLDKFGAGAVATAVPGGSVIVPAGMLAPFEAGFRFAALPSPVTLATGKYAIVAYGMNANDDFGEGGNVPLASTGIVHGDYDPFQFVDAASPAFPSGGDNNQHASASFRYESTVTPALRILPLGDSITYGYGGTNAGYRAALATLLDAANISFQFVGSAFDNPGMLPRDQRHHEGHSGWVIQGGTSGRPGLLENLGSWLGPSGSRADIVLLMIGTNDVNLSYDLASAENRLSALIAAIADQTYGLQPDAQIIIAQLVPIMDATEDAHAKSYNTSVANVVAAHKKRGEHIILVDMHTALTAPDFADKLHPNDAGYAKMAKVWFDAIKGL